MDKVKIHLFWLILALPLTVSAAETGELGKGIYCCDGAMFPESPATSPTFTIMANAARITEAAL